MSALDPRIEAVRDQYGLADSDFWQIPQNKQWVCKHAALEIVATKASVEWSAPQIVQADTANGIAVMVVSGKMGDRVEWATGEASPKNNKNTYPWAMAEKRGKDRVVLKLVGIHGLVYSEEEMPDEVRAKPSEPANTGKSAPKNDEARATYAALEKDMRQNTTRADLGRWWRDPKCEALRRKLPVDWQANLKQALTEYGNTLPEEQKAA